MMDLPPLPITPAVTNAAPSVIAEWSELMTAYLMHHLTFQGQLVSELTSEKSNTRAK
jgi:hypothetical protein